MKLPPNDHKEFELAPAGNHLAVCFQVIDLGTQQVEWSGQVKKQRKIILGWELPNEKMDDGQPFMISSRYTFSSFERAKLMLHLNSWRGRPFTDEEYGSFEMENLIGKGCFLNLIHEPSKDGSRTYCNIASIAALPKGTKTPELTNQPVYFSLDEPDEAVWHELPEWMQEIISRSPEYQALRNGPPVEAEQPFEDDEVPF